MADPRPVDPRSRLTSRTAHHLADALSRLRLDDLPAKGATRLVTRAIVAWAESLGWLPVPEMPLGWLEVEGEDGPEDRLGVVDLYVARPGYRSDLVIEIDRGNKLWSARKLGLAASRGHAAIWIRWGRPGSIADIELAEGVELIVLQAKMAPRVDRLTASLEPTFVPRTARPRFSGPALALLAAVAADGPRADDPAWNEAEFWRSVDGLGDRLSFIVRARFGARGGRPMTLAATAEALAEEHGTRIVTRERVRQLEKKAVARLRARWALAPKPPPGRAQQSRGQANELVAADVPGLPDLVRDLVAAGPPAGLTLNAITHILRGSPGPMTRRLVADNDLPHDGALAGVPYVALRPAVLTAARGGHLAVHDGYVRLREPEASD